MKLVLKGIRDLELIEESVQLTEKVGWVDLDVMYCGVCRTDAKLWESGHRDLILPCVPGHEIVAKFEDKHYAIWPGISCGECGHCIDGNENLCDAVKIMGFNIDGGFSSRISVPKKCLVPLPKELALPIACFAEPLGCVVNAFKKLDIHPGSRMLIYGAGTLGLLTALVAKRYKVDPVVIEESESKILKAAEFIKSSAINIVKDFSDCECQFDYVLNACGDVDAFKDGFLRVKKGGSVVYFSGLRNDVTLDSKTLNLIHYKEIALKGAYGHTSDDMKHALEILKELAVEVEHLVEGVISPSEIIGILPQVAEGMSYRYVIDFTTAHRF